MLKKILSFIFIYIFMVGCETTIYAPSECTECILELSIPNLSKDLNGYYRLNWLDGNLQTFARVEADVGNSYESVGWTSDTYFNGCTWGYCEPVSIVNESSYSDMDGIAYTLIGIYEDNIGDTAMIYCGYYRMGKQYLDSLGVIIDE
jgi:hypothetical protein|tara:strand:+ start:107 stop:547 length:441 start_codon:yes stop_codon:yes gene_type:complete